MSQVDQELCDRLDNNRQKDENAIQQLQPQVFRKREEVREAKAKLEKLQANLDRAEATAMLLPAATGALGGLVGRVVLGTIAEGMASMVSAVTAERAKGDMEEGKAWCEELRNQLKNLENLLHNARKNACQTVERMKAAGYQLPSSRAGHDPCLS